MLSIEYDKIYKAPYHTNGGDVCGYKVDKADLDNVLQMLRTAEQERDQYKAELESLSAKIKEAQEQKPVCKIKQITTYPLTGSCTFGVKKYIQSDEGFPVYSNPFICEKL